MTLNIFFFSITIKKRQASLVDAVQNELAENLFEQNRDRQISVHHFM
ncbi:YrzI family small protein [Neobacillus sp. NPDC058068]